MSLGKRQSSLSVQLQTDRRCNFSLFQLQSRFEQLKRLHADEKAALEEKKKLFEEDQSLFNKRRATAQLLQAQSLTANGKKDKDRKK